MLKRAASNAYSWWKASHIRTKQSRWLDGNLEEMENTVKKMLKVIEPDADSFAKRAELYFKMRPELISYVEDVYKAYRSLAERYDHISGELHKANHIIATSFPEQVQYSMLEDEENLPRAMTPINPSKINKGTVEGLMKKKKEGESSKKKGKKKKESKVKMDKEQAQEEISKLQKRMLALQTEKEFVKSSYESGIAKYWEIEKQFMEMHEKVRSLEQEYSTSSAIEENDARVLMAETVLNSCEDTIVKLQEQQKKASVQEKLEADRTEAAKEKLKALKGESCQVEKEYLDGEANLSSTTEIMEEDYSLTKTLTELQSIHEKIKEYLEESPESSVIEIAGKIEELANKVITMEITDSSRAMQINSLNTQNDELEKCIQSLEEDKVTLSDDANELNKRLEEAGDELIKVQEIRKTIQDEETNFRENFDDTWQSLNGVLEMLQPHTPSNNACIGEASLEEETLNSDADMQRETIDKEVTEIHDIKEITSEKDDQEKLDQEMKDTSVEKELSEADLSCHLISNEKMILDEEEATLKLQQLTLSGLEGKEKILLAGYTSILQNYKATKIKLSEVERKYEDYLEETRALIEELGELKIDIAMKDEEIRLLKRPMRELTKSMKRGSIDIQALTDEFLSVDSPFAEVLPTEASPAEAPLGKVLPAEAPLGKVLPAEAPSVEDPPTDAPGEAPPVKVIPAEEPPAEERPAEEPLAEESPAEESPAEESLAEEPPSQDPSVKVLRSKNLRIETPIEASLFKSILGRKKLEKKSNPAAAPPVEAPIKSKSGKKKLERKSNTGMDTWSPIDPELLMKNLGIEPSVKKCSSGKFKVNRKSFAERFPKKITPFEMKFRNEIDGLLDEKLEFWLRFSTSFCQIQEIKGKYEDLEADIRAKDNKSQECTDIIICDQVGKYESEELTISLRDLKTELNVWLEQGTLLKEDLQSRYSALCNMQEEILSVLNEDSESGELLISPYKAERFQGEVVNMKLENCKVESELQVGLDQGRGLYDKIEEQLRNVGPFVSKNIVSEYLENPNNSKTNAPLRDFLFGVKPKKSSILGKFPHGKIKSGLWKMDKGT